MICDDFKCSVVMYRCLKRIMKVWREKEGDGVMRNVEKSDDRDVWCREKWWVSVLWWYMMFKKKWWFVAKITKDSIFHWCVSSDDKKRVLQWWWWWWWGGECVAVFQYSRCCKLRRAGVLCCVLWEGRVMGFKKQDNVIMSKIWSMSYDLGIGGDEGLSRWW